MLLNHLPLSLSPLPFPAQKLSQGSGESGDLCCSVIATDRQLTHESGIPFRFREWESMSGNTGLVRSMAIGIQYAKGKVANCCAMCCANRPTLGIL